MVLQKIKVAQCPRHGRNELAELDEYCGRLGGSCSHTISMTVIWKKEKTKKEISINFEIYKGIIFVTSSYLSDIFQIGKKRQLDWKKYTYPKKRE